MAKKTIKKKIVKKATKKVVRKTVIRTARSAAQARAKATRVVATKRKLSEKQERTRSKRVYANPAKRKVAVDMLERYTGHEIHHFKDYIILTNFHYYTERFCSILPDAYYTKGSAFKAASSEQSNVTIVEFGIGSAMAALVVELIAVLEPKACLFLGMCGATHNSLNVGDFVLPIGAIRTGSVAEHFMPVAVPALPTFKIQKFASQVLVEHGFDYRTGVVHSTDLRFWEFDEDFKHTLYQERVIAVEMECATLFITGFASKVTIGALLLVSDCPLKKGGIKTKKSANNVFKNYTDQHIEMGIEIMADLVERGDKIRHYRW